MAEWISVEERLPEIGQEVLAWGARRGHIIVEYSKSSHIHRTLIRIDGQWWNNGERIAYWMPLPDPPEPA